MKPYEPTTKVEKEIWEASKRKAEAWEFANISREEVCEELTAWKIVEETKEEYEFILWMS
jgi:hypothetical protein